MPTVSQYINSITLYDRIIKERTGGLTHEDSMKQLPVPANCMNWVLGHILVYRVRNLGVIDGATQPDPAEWMLYGAGSEPLTDGSIAIPLDTLLARIADASEVLISALQSMPEGRLGELFDAESGTTIDERLNYYLVFHEAYHVGQLEVLQELALAGKQA